MSELKIENFVMEDGRLAEKHVKDEGNQKVTDIYVEPKRNKNLAHRIIEKKANVVISREIETIDENTGEVIEKKVESCDPTDKMEVREHIVASPSMYAQSVQEDPCYVTKQDLSRFAGEMASQTKEAILLATKALSAGHKNETVSAMQIAVGEKIEEQKATNSSKELFLYALVGLGAAAILYVQFVM